MNLSVPSPAPDPYMPHVGFSLRSGKDISKCSLQHQRRAEILATTRRILAEAGNDNFTIRAVSESCQLTAQTIYNSFGNKTELLRAAINQHTAMIDSYALSRTSHPAVFLVLALAYCQTALERPEFMREFLRATFSPKKPLRESLIKFGTGLKVKILRDIARSNQLRPYVNTAIAAEQIAYVNTFAVLDWAENDDIQQLYERLVMGNGTILLGILAPEPARAIEAWLNDQTNRQWHCGEPADHQQKLLAVWADRLPRPNR